MKKMNNFKLFIISCVVNSFKKHTEYSPYIGVGIVIGLCILEHKVKKIKPLSLRIAESS